MKHTGICANASLSYKYIIRASCVGRKRICCAICSRNIACCKTIFISRRHIVYSNISACGTNNISCNGNWTERVLINIKVKNIKTSPWIIYNHPILTRRIGCVISRGSYRSPCARDVFIGAKGIWNYGTTTHSKPLPTYTCCILNVGLYELRIADAT